LLQKEKGKRLGAVNDSVDIKNHPFFASVDWDSLDKKAISPPYNPNTVSFRMLYEWLQVVFIYF